MTATFPHYHAHILGRTVFGSENFPGNLIEAKGGDSKRAFGLGCSWAGPIKPPCPPKGVPIARAGPAPRRPGARPRPRRDSGLAKASITMAKADLWNARLAVKTLRRDQREAIAESAEG